MTILSPGQIRMTCRATLSTGQIVEASHVIQEEAVSRPEWREHIEAALRYKLLDELLKAAPPAVHYER